MPRAYKNITDYWYKHYVNKGLCSLCGNFGIIDTRGISTPAGVEVGRLNWCVCPNGQVHAKAHAGEPPKT